ncbi:hypothetical protein BG011_007165 [Mortierella polycephala]|uniref:DDHD domain-containing protein n=1 Tax=Mortierella polycephala TaxID=41804 RepID=A0A9P6U7S7_9FUNG|nr:hypothetical protein BG011_007165 [Mortierella polycephala]
MSVQTTSEANQVNGDTTHTEATSTPTSTSTSEPTSNSSSTSSSSSSTSVKSDDEPDQQSHHVIFIVHGMGRQLEEFGNYERNLNHLVENTKVVLQNQFYELDTNVHIIPIEWHTKLHSMVDDRMSLASLRTVPKVRLVMNDYFADILYYFNSHFGNQIISTIVEELNEAYDNFLEKHPDFNGKISIYALSLGGIAMFDILTCLDDDRDEGDAVDKKSNNTASESMETQNQQECDDEVKEPTQKRPRIRKQDQSKFQAVIPRIKFRPDYLFTVGSPLGAVLVMRNLDWESFHPPDDIIHHNIFHPFDPLGYRIEPLIDSVFAGIPASQIRSYSSSQLFPSLSLPSLPSLLPGSISSFWENRVPTLPRPSIPTLSSLSQMTQSLKAGRWLSSSGNVSATTEESNVTTTITTEATDTGDDGDVDDDAASLDSRGITRGSDGGARVPKRDQEAEEEGESMVVDAEASVTEYMAAATVATYLDQGTGAARPADPALNKPTTTTTGSTAATRHGKPFAPSRRPSLGPHKVSSRSIAEDERPDISSLNKEESQRKMSYVPEESSDGVTPMNMECYLSMDQGVSAEEEAQGAGAKSDVVQEPIIRSMPETSSASSKNGMQTTVEDADDTTAEDSAKPDQPKARTVHVEGRATKVPYRIDHVLQETTVDQYTNEYLLSMRSHFRYWGNRDVAYHILRTMLESNDTSSSESGILDLKLDTPAPSTGNKGTMDAAKAKAKATAAATAVRSRASSTGSTDLETKKLNRRSFTFSFFGGQQQQQDNNSSTIEQQLRRQRQEESDEDSAMMDEEHELFGDRYSDLNMSSHADSDYRTVSSKSSTSMMSTLYQNSPFASTSAATTVTTMTTAYASETYRNRSSTKRRISMHIAKDNTITNSNSNVGDEVVSSSSASASRATIATATAVSVATSSTNDTTAATTVMAFDEGVVVVPDLARPVKLHHRSSRIEEKQ